jgi:hypothetical protein
MHIIPCFDIFICGTSELPLDLGNGLDETFQQNLQLSLFIIGDETVYIGFVLLRARDFIDELFRKCIEQLLEHDSAVDGFEASDKIRYISPAGHVVYVQLFVSNLGQILH